MRFADNKCTYVEIYKPFHGYIFTGICVVTKKQFSVTVKAGELFAYRQGAFMQDAFRSLSAGEREFLMSGISPEGWRKTFS